MKFRSLQRNTWAERYSLKALLLGLILAVAIPGMAQSVQLVTGKSILSPPLGTQVNVGSLPTNMILSPDGKFAIVSDGGFDQSLTAIDASSGSKVSSIFYDNCDYCDFQTTNGLYYGLAFGTNGTLYAAQGGNNTIDVLTLGSDGTLTDLGSFPATQPSDFPSGLATDSRGYLYVANNDPVTPFLPGSVAIYAQNTQKEVGRYSFTQSYFGTPNFPLAIVTLADGSKTYVSSERDGAVYVLNTSDPTNPTLTRSIATGANPDGLLFNQTQTVLYVANGGSDTVTVVRTADDAVLGTVLLRPGALRHVAGTSTPTGMGLSPDGSTLYVALGDLNAIAVLAVHGGKLTVKGYIPTGWYPSAVVSPSQNTILFSNAKGTTPYYPNPDYVQWAFNASHDYDQHLIEGQVSLVSLNNTDLSELTEAVLANNAVRSDAGLEALSRKHGGIKHVIYIVKENRTYDQVLGDIPQGNGDPSLTLFGQDVTPNLHALAQRFILLDNIYTSGEVSYDGWVWSTQAIGDEQLIKAAPYNYSGRGHNYNAEGQNNGFLVGGFPAKDPDGNLISPVYFPNGAPSIPDITQVREDTFGTQLKPLISPIATTVSSIRLGLRMVRETWSSPTTTQAQPAFCLQVTTWRASATSIIGVTTTATPTAKRQRTMVARTSAQPMASTTR
jgi:DNA-binding beta-propeller fold protein YncE